MFLIALWLTAQDPVTTGLVAKESVIRLQPIARGAWSNDAMGGVPSRDDGFTNDLEILGGVQFGVHRAALYARHRMITEKGSLLRTDQVDVWLSHSWRFDVGDSQLFFEPRMGLGLSGNLGGRDLQSWFHNLPGIRGRKLGAGLQDTYANERRGSFLLGGAVVLQRSVHPVVLFQTGIDAQAALGPTGVHALLGSLGGTLRIPYWVIVPSVQFDLMFGAFATADLGLRLRGGYVVNQFLAMPRIRFAIRHSSFSFGWETRINEGGAGQATGAFFFEWNAQRTPL